MGDQTTKKKIEKWEKREKRNEIEPHLPAKK